jgi:hypothetical protein
VLLHEGVVLRELLQDAAAQEIAAAVPHVGEDGAVAPHGRGHAGGPHAPQLGVRAGLLKDRVIRGEDPLVERLRDVLVGDVLQVLQHLHEDRRDCLRRHPAGDLAARLAPHAVGDQEEAVQRTVEVRPGQHGQAVLVHLPDASHVRLLSDGKGWHVFRE